MADLVTLEYQVVRTLFEDTPAGKAARSLVSKDLFTDKEVAYDTYRLFAKAQAKGAVPAWEVVRASPHFSKDARSAFKRTKTRPLKKIKDVEIAVESLQTRALRYKLGHAANKWIEELNEETCDPNKVLADIFADTGKIKHQSDLTRDLSSLFGADADNIVSKFLNRKAIDVVRTGFASFDLRNLGIQRGTLMTIGGPTGQGKSLVATTLGVQAAALGSKVLKLCLEMSEEHELARILAGLSGLKASSIFQAHKLSKTDKKFVGKAFKRFQGLQEKSGGRFDLICPKHRPTMGELLAWLRSKDYDMVIVDYLGLMNGINDSDQSWRTMGEAAAEAGIYAQSTGTVMVLLAQVTDEGKMRYSQAVQEHAALSWIWNRTEDGEEKERKGDKKGDKKDKPKSFKDRSNAAFSQGTYNPIRKAMITMPKCRNHSRVDFEIHIDFSRMRVEEVKADLRLEGIETLTRMARGIERVTEKKVKTSEAKLPKAKKDRSKPKKKVDFSGVEPSKVERRKPREESVASSRGTFSTGRSRKLAKLNAMRSANRIRMAS